MRIDPLVAADLVCNTVHLVTLGVRGVSFAAMQFIDAV